MANYYIRHYTSTLGEGAWASVMQQHGSGEYEMRLPSKFLLPVTMVLVFVVMCLHYLGNQAGRVFG